MKLGKVLPVVLCGVLAVISPLVQANAETKDNVARKLARKANKTADAAAQVSTQALNQANSTMNRLVTTFGPAAGAFPENILDYRNCYRLHANTGSGYLHTVSLTCSRPNVDVMVDHGYEIQNGAQAFITKQRPLFQDETKSIGTPYGFETTSKSLLIDDGTAEIATSTYEPHVLDAYIVCCRHF